MKAGNISKHIDLTKPQSQEAIRSAIRKMQAEEKPVTVRQVAKADYGLELLRPNIVAHACAALTGSLPRTLPHFVKQ